MKRRIVVVAAVAFTLFVVFALSPARHAQGFKKFDLKVAYVQDGAPVQLNSLTHDVEFLYSKAEVKNVSDRTVRSVTFGVLLHETAPNRSAPILASSREIQTDIKPGGVRTIEVLDLPMKVAQQKATELKSNRVVAEFGILGVGFDDGSSWRFDLQKKGAFSTSMVSTPTDPSTKMNCKPTISSGLVALLGKVIPPLAVVLAQGYQCTGSPYPELCTNQGQSCSRRLCTHDEVIHKTCPYQQCQWI
jgi:hypothetical protein